MSEGARRAAAPSCACTRLGLVLALGLFLPLGGSLRAQQSYLLVISGLGGEEHYSDNFYRWSIALLEAADAAGLPESNLIYLAEDPSRDPQRIRDRSSKENVEKTLAELVARGQPEDQIWIVLIGHGSHQAGGSRFNLPGRDMTDEDFARQLAPLRSRVAFVNTSSASGGFVPTLSAENRVIVTATKSGFEGNETVFGEYFTQAFTDADKKADVNKDDRISVLEGFDYARVHVTRFYEEQNRLLTEHPILDDNGDGKGIAEPAPTAEDGTLASRLFLGQDPGVGEVPAEIAQLLKEKRRLEERIAELRTQRESLSEELYLEELETLLLDLATKDQALRKFEESHRETGEDTEGESGEKEGESGEKEGESGEKEGESGEKEGAEGRREGQP